MKNLNVLSIVFFVSSLTACGEGTVPPPPERQVEAAEMSDAPVTGKPLDSVPTKKPKAKPAPKPVEVAAPAATPLPAPPAPEPVEGLRQSGNVYHGIVEAALPTPPAVEPAPATSTPVPVRVEVPIPVVVQATPPAPEPAPAPVVVQPPPVVVVPPPAPAPEPIVAPKLDPIEQAIMDATKAQVPATPAQPEGKIKVRILRAVDFPGQDLSVIVQSVVNADGANLVSPPKTIYEGSIMTVAEIYYRE